MVLAGSWQGWFSMSTTSVQPPSALQPRGGRDVGEVGDARDHHARPGPGGVERVRPSSAAMASSSSWPITQTCRTFRIVVPFGYCIVTREQEGRVSPAWTSAS